MDARGSGRAGGPVNRFESNGDRPLDRRMLHDTGWGAVAGAFLLGGLSVFQAIHAGVGLARVFQPILVFALIGLTVGALAGPLVGKASRRRRSLR